ncbi:MAG: HPF/RaiA family ribosome-associated protein [Acidobacteriota bacterium]
MNVLINTGHNIDGRERLIEHFQKVVESALDRFSGQITTLEVHLRDENGDKGGPADKRCMIEARVENRQPTVVTHYAATLDEAVDGAAEKMGRKLDSTIERLRERR